MYAIFAYIVVVPGVNVGTYANPMECLGLLPFEGFQSILS